MDENDLSTDPEIKKMSLLVVNTLTLLSTFIPITTNVVSAQVRIIKISKCRLV